ncbi:MAG: hypothetical protein ACXWP5_12965 [Bdellovibrionota bacterium]
MSLTLGLSLLAGMLCTRTYAPTHEIRLVGNIWQIGQLDGSNQWAPLSCNPNLNPGFLGAVDGNTLDVQGEGHLGEGAAFVIHPTEEVPASTHFTINPMGLFGDNRIEIDLADRGWVFLDRTKFQQKRFEVSGLNLEIDSEPANTEIQVALDTLGTLTSLFPVRKTQITEHGGARLILAMNEAEKFQEQPIRPNGFYHQGSPYYAVLFSQDGKGARLHAMHELGGLFRIFGSVYAQGLTWMVAFDQIEKLAPTPENKLEQKCGDLETVISNIDDTAVQNGVSDYSHSMEFYMADPIATGGWGIFAWTTGVYWKKINAALDAQGIPDMYSLINSIHEHVLEPSEKASDLDDLISAYARMSPSAAPQFSQLALSTFRQKSLGQHKQEALAEKAGLGCQDN